MTRCFLALYRFLRQRRLLRAGLLLLLAAAAVAGAARIRFQEDIAVFLPDGASSAQLRDAYRHISSSNKIVLNIALTDTLSADGTDLLVEAADDLAARLQQAETARHFSGMQYTADAGQMLSFTGVITDHLPCYLTDSDYVRISRTLQPDIMRERLETLRTLLTSPAGGVLKNVLLQDPLGWASPVWSDLQSFRLNDAFRLYDDHFFTADLRRAVILLDGRYPASETAHGAAMIAAIDDAITACQDTFGGRIRITPFGAAHIAQSNAGQIRKDSLYSILTAVMLIIGLLLCYFRRGTWLLLVMLPIAFGFLAALGITGWISPDFSSIAMGIGAIMLGIAVNYPLHYLSHRKEGYDTETSLGDVTAPLTTGNITTIGAFLSLLFVSAPAMRNFGLFAAAGLFGTILCVLVFLPHWSERCRPVAARPFARLAEWEPEHHRGVLLCILLVTCLLYTASRHVTLNPDLQQINYMTEEQRALAGDMLQQTQGSSHLTYLVSAGNNLEEALVHFETVQQHLDDGSDSLAFMEGVSGLGRMLPSQARQAERIAIWNAYWQERRDAFKAGFTAACADAGFRPEAFRTFLEIIDKPYAPEKPEAFGEIYKTLASNYITQDERGAMVFTMLHTPDREAAAAEAWGNAVEAHSFAFDAGTLTRRMVRVLSEDFDTVLFLCSGIVLLCLLLAFASLELALTAFIPLWVGWIWILGIMGVTGLEFNIVNIILATFIFGMGDDYTIFMIEGMMHEYTYGRKMMHTYKSTVLLSALIMLAGIGSLVVARHPAMKSLGQVTLIGMTAVVAAACLIPPVIYRWLTVKKGRFRKVPLTLRNYLYTVFAFTAFFIGAAWLNLAGCVLTLTIRNKKARRKKFHRMLCGICRFVIRNVPGTSLDFPEIPPDTFKEPAVIVANHQSHLDLMAVLALSPDMVVITNQWAWHSPFYGTILRFADFLPAEELNDSHMQSLEALMQDGYSVMIFPEGTRTDDGRTGRFHQGAFQLARHCHVRIIPVMLHGFHEVLPKEDLLLRPGHLTVRVLPAMVFQEDETCLALARRCRQTVNAALQETADHVQHAAWYRQQVLDHYLYKPAGAVRTVRRFLRHGGDALDRLPESGRCFVRDDVFGACGLWAALLRPKASVDVLCADPAQADIAVHCHYLPENLHFITETPDTAAYDCTVRCTSGTGPVILQSASHA